MDETKLPPGPWRANRGGYSPYGELLSLVDAEGDRVDLTSDEVLRAVEALPLLVETARELVAKIGETGWIGGGSYSWVKLRDALALVDGEGRADG